MTVRDELHVLRAETAITRAITALRTARTHLERVKIPTAVTDASDDVLMHAIVSLVDVTEALVIEAGSGEDASLSG